MVTILKRMRRLRSLLEVRLGPGAAVISGDVKRIHLNFARKINDGHMGPRKFWHHYLPRLKYHNPAIPMTVEQTNDQEEPASLTVFFASSSSEDSPAPAPTSSTSSDTSPSKHEPFSHTKSIDMKHKKESQILAELLELTDGKPVTATAEEMEQLRILKEEDARSEVERAKQAEVVRAKKRQAELLERAKSSMI